MPISFDISSYVQSSFTYVQGIEVTTTSIVLVLHNVKAGSHCPCVVGVGVGVAPSRDVTTLSAGCGPIVFCPGYEPCADVLDSLHGILSAPPTGRRPFYDASNAAMAAQKLLRLSESLATLLPLSVTMLMLAFVLMANISILEFSIEIMLSWQLLASTHCCA